MLIVPPQKFLKKQPTIKPPPMVVATGPVLVSADYDDTIPTVTLGFDRAIDASSMNVAAVVVDDGSINNMTYQGDYTPYVVNESTIRLQLVSTGSDSSGEVVLNVAADSGIVAVGSGASWAGASELGLPFP